MKKMVFVLELIVFAGFFCISSVFAAQAAPEYKYKETKDLVALVNSAALLIGSKGEAAFPEFKIEGSQWKSGDTDIFVIDTSGNMLICRNKALEGKNQIDLKDVNGKPVIKEIIEEAAAPGASEGWVFYQWPEPGTIFSSWKSVFYKSVVSPAGKKLIVCGGSYDIKMEDAFLADAVDAAVALIEKNGRDAFGSLRDISGQFVFLGTYIFVDTPDGVEVVNGGFPNIEGQNIIDYKDPNGKYLTREIIDTAVNKGSGWVDYMWPKPGDTKPSNKRSYIKKAVYGPEVFAVGAGAYLDTEPVSGAEQIESAVGKMMVLEFKSGDMAVGEILRETKDSIYAEHPDGTMEVSFPRSIITKIRPPTEKELAKIKASLAENQDNKTPVSGKAK